MASVPASRSRWWLIPLILLLVLAALAGLYALAGYYGVPYLVQRYAPEAVAKLGRKLEIGEVRFDPFRFDARIAGLRLTEGDGSPLLAFEALEINADVVHSLAERGVVLDRVALTAPDVAVVVNADGSINLAQIVPPSTEPATPTPPGPLPRVRIGELVIAQGRVGIEDRSRPQPFSLAFTPIELSLRDFRTEAQHDNAYAFRATASTGEQIAWDGGFTVQPLGSRGHIALGKLQASTLASYLQDQLPLRLLSGEAELAGDYQLAFDPELSLELQLPAVTLRQLAVAERGKGKTAPPLSVAEVAVKDVQVSLARREVRLDSIGIRGLRAEVFRERDGSLNLQRLAGPPPEPGKSAPVPAPAPSDASKPPAEATPWSVTVGAVQLADAALQLEDRTVQPVVKLALKPLSLSVRGLRSDLKTPLKLDARLGIGPRGRLEAQAEVQVQPLKVGAALDLQGVDLTLLQPYLAPLTGVTLRSGQLAVKGRLDFAQPPKGEPKIAFDGQAAVSALDLQDRVQRQELLAWRELRLTGLSYRSLPAALNVDRLALIEPRARVVIAENREINVVQALAAPGAPPAVASPPAPAASGGKAGPGLAVKIRTLSVEQGQMQFADRSIEPQFAAGIFALNGQIVGLSSDLATAAQISLQGKVDEFAPVTISGQLIPADYASNTDIALSFHNMDLVRFNPYSGRFAGYNIVKGKLTTDLKYKIRNRELEAEHHVVLDQLEFGEATGSKDAVPLPVKLAVSLLKDRHGVIDLGLPVRGSLDDPTFRVGPLVWKVLVNLLSKAVTAPFSALASLFGGGEDLAYVDFAPGSAELSSVESGKLQNLARALVERPQVKLDVPLAQADVEDARALGRRELDRRLPPPAAALAPEAAGKERLRALEALHQQVIGAALVYAPEVEALDAAARPAARMAALEAALVAALTPGAAELEKLSAERARAVQSAVLANAEVAPERVFLTSRRAASVSDHGTVRMELSLQ